MAETDRAPRRRMADRAGASPEQEGRAASSDAVAVAEEGPLSSGGEDSSPSRRAAALALSASAKGRGTIRSVGLPQMTDAYYEKNPTKIKRNILCNH